MKYKKTESSVFPLVEITLGKGEEIRIERGAMVYHNGEVGLEGKMNSNGGNGLGGALKALGRSMVSNEGFFITTATGLNDNAVIGIAPGTPGAIKELEIGSQQWRINDGAFLACDAGVNYSVKRQSLGKAMFAGTGGLFVMETLGQGKMLINAYGDILEFDLTGDKTLTVDNTHVVAWSTSLDYEIKVASGAFGFKTGEGLVNEFRGQGKVYVQTRNVQALADMIVPFVPKG